jgi:hypothetical protein
MVKTAVAFAESSFDPIGSCLPWYMIGRTKPVSRCSRRVDLPRLADARAATNHGKQEPTGQAIGHPNDADEPAG